MGNSHCSTKAKAVRYSIKDEWPALLCLQDERNTPPSCDVLQLTPCSVVLCPEPGCSQATWRPPLKSQQHGNEVAKPITVSEDREAPGWDTCLHLDGTAADGSHGLAHKVHVHLGGVFLELCQDLWGHQTNVSPWGHSENSPPSHVMLLGHQKTSNIFCHSYHTHPAKLSLTVRSPLVWLHWCVIQTGVGYTWCRWTKSKGGLLFIIFNSPEQELGKKQPCQT